MRQIFDKEPNLKVVQLISELLNYYENYKFKNNKLTEYDKKKINDIRKDIEELRKEDDCKVIIDEDVDKLIQKISTRNAQLNEMALDEKLKELGNLIEYLLKRVKSLSR
ncbi:hypothetical protein [Clostridium sp. UBA1056]|uniref:hypothetical protein n=1 Tax=unclassified Clostridium TaxID=2614128 RepID=UPI003217B149